MASPQQPKDKELNLKNFTTHVGHRLGTHCSDVAIQLIDEKYYHGFDDNNPREVFQKWKDTDPNASWEKLIAALRSPNIALNVLAQEFEKKFVKGDQADSTAVNQQANGPPQANVQPMPQATAKPMPQAVVEPVQATDEPVPQATDEPMSQAVVPVQATAKPKISFEDLEKDYIEAYEKIEKLDGKNKMFDEKNLKPKYLIEVVNQIEFFTVIVALHKGSNGAVKRFYSMGKFGESLDYYYCSYKSIPILLMDTGCTVGSHYGSGSWYRTMVATTSFPSIEYVIAVGVCGGVPGKVSFGDVVVSSGIYGYDHRKVKGDQDIIRAVTENLQRLKLFEHFSEADKKHVFPDEKEKLKVHHRGILSGSILVSSSKERERLLSCFRSIEIVAFEMEGAGIAAACSTMKKECLVIKGISDFADESKGDEWQPTAAHNAAKYTFNRIEYHEEREAATKKPGEVNTANLINLDTH